MLSHYTPLPHLFLQPWMKLSKCTIKTHVRSERLVGHVRPPSRIPDMLAGHVWPPSQIPERLAGHVRPQPGHVRPQVWVSEGIGLSMYRLIYRLGRVIFSRFPPVAVDFLARRPAVARPARFPAKSDRFSPRRRGFLRSSTHPRAPPGLSAQPPITARFLPVFTTPPPISALRDRLQLLSRPEQIRNKESTLLPSWRDQIPYT
jgi:hypothetical protein